MGSRDFCFALVASLGAAGSVPAAGQCLLPTDSAPSGLATSPNTGAAGASVSVSDAEHLSKVQLALLSAEFDHPPFQSTKIDEVREQLINRLKSVKNVKLAQAFVSRYPGRVNLPGHALTCLFPGIPANWRKAYLALYPDTAHL